LVPQAAAEVVFRTGFYRVTVPLGQCRTCWNAERAAAMLKRQTPSKDHKQDAMLA
jgi:hypothetical protein